MINELLFAVFLVVIVVLLIANRKKLDREGIVFLRRTKKGVNFIDKVTSKIPRFWNGLFSLGAVVAIGAMFFASYFIINAAIGVLAGISGGVKLVLPGPVSNAVSGPAVLLMPWYFWIIGIIALTVPHEFAHGVASRLHKINLKSVGMFFLVIVPGAFVEPDEKQLKAAKASTKIKIYGAGSFANFLMALLFFGIMLMYVPATLNTNGLYVGGLEAGLPMANANASGALLSLNGISITSVDQLAATTSAIAPGTIINVEMTSGNYTIQTVMHEDREGSRLGVVGPYMEYREIKPELVEVESVIFFFGQLFDWIILLNLGVGLVNLLPIKPLDGGFIMEAIVEKISGKKHRRTGLVVKAITLAFLLLLLYSVFGGLI